MERLLRWRPSKEKGYSVLKNIETQPQGEQTNHIKNMQSTPFHMQL